MEIKTKTILSNLTLKTRTRIKISTIYQCLRVSLKSQLLQFSKILGAMPATNKTNRPSFIENRKMLYKNPDLQKHN